VKKLEGRVVYNTPVSDFKELQLKYPGAVFLFTTPFSITQKITGLKLADLKMIGAVNLILELSEQFFADKTYWLNINEKDYPFVAVVEHTNFVDKKHYGGKHILYVGGYYPQNHRYFTMSKEEILKEWRPYLHNINFKFQILNFKLARALYAQPIVGLNHHKFIPEITTKLPGVYVANMEMVYPWDRGTNYAIELGERAAKIIAS
jgi:protoporphyrinogen oxidase